MDTLSAVGTGVASIAALGAAAYYMTSFPEPIHPCVDINKQSVILEDGSRISPLMLKQNGGKYMETLYDDVKTMYDGFQRGLRISRNGPCLGKRSGPNREYEWETYQQVSDRSEAFGSGLVHIGVKPSTETFLGIYSSNRFEWFIADRAASMFSMVIVPLYDTLGPESCQHIIHKVNSELVICDNETKVKMLLDIASRVPSLKTIVAMDTISDEMKTKAAEASIKVVYFDDLEELGKKHPAQHVPPKPEDLLTISFTSGTTGPPKGVMLTHANVVASFGAFIYPLQSVFDFAPHNCHLSYLPLAHMFERIVQMMFLTNGISFGFYSGDVTLLFDDLRALKPTIFCTVPRLINKLRDKIYSSVAGNKLKSLLLDVAVSRKTAYVKRGIVTKDTIWDKLVFRKIQNLLGGHVTMVITGSAPVSTETLTFFKSATGCPVFEVYGQTEATAPVTSQVPGDVTDGHVGSPLVCNSVKLVDVPELGYYAADNKGEICVKGTNVFVGYYKEPEKTSECFDEEGWLHTGDIGLWLPSGALKVIDRKKHIFKLSQGEYIAPEKVEQVYMRSVLVAQAFVDGNSLKRYCMGVVVPDPDTIVPWAAERGDPTDLAQLCQSQKAKDAVLQSLHEEGEKAGLKGFEQVKDIKLWPEAFTVTNNLITPTFKARRPELRRKFQSEIDKLYEMNNL